MTTPADDSPAVRRIDSAGRSLKFSLVLWMGLGAMGVLGAFGWHVDRAVRRFLEAQADARLLDASHRSEILMDRLILERAREAEMLATSPTVVDAARAGAELARALGLAEETVPALERRFAAERTLDADPRARRYLRGLVGPLGAAEVFVTDAAGHVAVSSGRTSDFVQRDEVWWQRALRDGTAPPETSFDESAGETVVTLVRTVRDGADGPPVGVLKVAFGLTRINEALARASEVSGISVDLVDAVGNVVASSSGAALMRPFPGYDSLIAAGRDSVITYAAGATRQRAAVRATNGGRWQVIAHLDEAEAFAHRAAAQRWLYLTAGGLLAFLVTALLATGHFIERRVSAPAAQLAAAAEAVAGGNLAVRIAPSESDDEIGRLGRAIASMIDALRRLASALRRSAAENAAVATEITVGSDHMASAAQDSAQTSNDLSQQSLDMAAAIQGMAADAGLLVGIAAELDAGAHEGVERNGLMRDLSRQNRDRLDANARALAALAGEVRSSAGAIEALAAASEQIRNFVTLVRTMARQSKLLALNAAMEAARAGEQGEGFAVVASEVRRLAASSADAAERTEAVVSDVLQRVEATRVSSQRAVETAEAVLAATQEGHQAFDQIERAVVDSEAWTSAIERAAAHSNDLVVKITQRLDELSRGTESFAAAMEEVAASSQEQSASTQQIASVAEQLGKAAERLAKLVATFRLGDEDAAPPEPAAAPDAPAAPGAAYPAPLAALQPA